MADTMATNKKELGLTEEEKVTGLVVKEDDMDEKPSDLIPELKEFMEDDEMEEKPSDLLPKAEVLKEEDDYVPRFEIRERTLGLANPKIIPLNKENLGRIMIGLFSLKEIKELEKKKRESQVGK